MLAFKCKRCNKAFPDDTALKTHFKAESECGNNNENKKVLNQRYKEKNKVEVEGERIAKNTNNWKCKFCKQNFKLRNELKDHIKSKHFKLNCKECNAEFKAKMEYRKHMKQHDLFCLYCNEEFKTTTKINHLFIKHNTCPCGEKFEKRKELELHQDAVHNKFQVHQPKEKRTQKFTLNPEYL